MYTHTEVILLFTELHKGALFVHKPSDGLSGC